MTVETSSTAATKLPPENPIPTGMVVGERSRYYLVLRRFKSVVDEAVHGSLHEAVWQHLLMPNSSDIRPI
jgi:hypothetical protein